MKQRVVDFLRKHTPFDGRTRLERALKCNGPNLTQALDALIAEGKISCRREGRSLVYYLGALPAQQEPTPIERVERADTLHAVRAENKLMVREVQRLREELELHRTLQATPCEPIVPGKLSATKRTACGVALLSDLHYGEVTPPGSVPYANHYNTQVAALRLRRFFAALRWLIEKNRSWATLNELLLWFGGDLITGHLHPELQETALAAVPSVVQLRPLLVGGIQHLLEIPRLRIRIVCSYGNHGRDTLKPRRQTGAHHSYEWGMYQDLGAHLPSDRVQITADPTPHQYAEAYGRTLHFHHGDEIRYGGGVGGITIPINKAVAAWNEVRHADIHHFGHFHQEVWGGNWVVNNCLCGYGSYAMSIKAKPSPASQVFYVLDAKRGPTARSSIWVEDREAERELV